MSAALSGSPFRRAPARPPRERRLPAGVGVL